MLEAGDIQGIVLSAFSYLPYSRFLFLHFVDRKSAHEWLHSVIPDVVTAARKDSVKLSTATNVAFTQSGLTRFSLSDATLATFPREFINGMAEAKCSRRLGDVETSDPATWQFGGPGTREIHSLLMLYGKNEETLEALHRKHLETLRKCDVQRVYEQDCGRMSDYEPFGFRDGISQPVIEGSTRQLPGQTVIKAGEFLLGYENEYEQISLSPMVSIAEDRTDLLASDPNGSGRKDLGRNGTFLVLRKLSQNVDAFRNFCDQATRNADGSPNPAESELLAAKFVGRWRSGAPLTLRPYKDDATLGGDSKRNNDFMFSRSDRDGYACPIGSHIRRMNPRDALLSNERKSLEVGNRHRILRRGRRYEDPPSGDSGKADQGLVFVAINADIQRQFEFLQQTWLNNEKFLGLHDSQDPLVGDHQGGGRMEIQDKPVRRRIHGLPRFVDVKGGGYFFLPSLRGLRFLALERR